MTGLTDAPSDRQGGLQDTTSTGVTTLGQSPTHPIIPPSHPQDSLYPLALLGWDEGRENPVLSGGRGGSPDWTASSPSRNVEPWVHGTGGRSRGWVGRWWCNGTSPPMCPQPYWPRPEAKCLSPAVGDRYWACENMSQEASLIRASSG